ncbi:MAG: hypothetical protein Q9226_008365 [Calogaya cf. arnoldii]
MGTCGSGLYQSDIDLDMLDLIAEEALKMMSDPECLRSAMVPEFFTLRAPIDRVATVQQLEDGVLHRMIRRFSHQKNHGAIVILGVVCMELGARFNPEDVLSIKMALTRWDANKIKKDQVCHAFESYQNNGAVWRFDGTKEAELALSPQGKDAEAKERDMPDVIRGTDNEDAITPVPTARPQVRTRSDSLVNAKYSAQLTRLEKFLLESDAKPAAVTTTAPTRARVLPAQQPRKQERITSWLPLPSTKSQVDLTLTEDRKIDERKPGECLFSLPIPVRGSSKAATTVIAWDYMDDHRSESMYQLSGGLKPVRKAKGKEVKWEEMPPTIVKEHRKKLSLGRKE